MRTFFHKNCSLDLPDRSTLSKAPLTDMYKSLLEQVKCELKSVKSAKLIFDGWTDKYKKMPYLGIGLAFINDKWDFKIFTLNSTPLEYLMAENIKTHVKDIITNAFLVDLIKFAFILFMMEQQT